MEDECIMFYILAAYIIFLIYLCPKACNEHYYSIDTDLYLKM